MFPTYRGRRLRSHPALRDLVQETRLSVKDLVCPIFIKQGLKGKQSVETLPGQFQFGLDALADEAKSIADLGIPAVLLFGVPEHKDALGSRASKDEGVIQQAISVIKTAAPALLVITDVCFCEYTDHAHCGVIKETPQGWDVDNDETLIILGQQAVSHARAGSDMIAPSGMMDGQVLAIRDALDVAGFPQLPIMSYSAKFASHFYGAFRAAAESGLAEGDRSTYQMPYTNTGEALREVEADIAEGADIIMVKPALAYLDVIARVKDQYPEMLLATYSVGTEYAMLKAAIEKGLMKEEHAILETHTAMKRAGADILITYFAKVLAGFLK